MDVIGRVAIRGRWVDEEEKKGRGRNEGCKRTALMLMHASRVRASAVMLLRRGMQQMREGEVGR